MCTVFFFFLYRSKPTLCVDAGVYGVLLLSLQSVNARFVPYKEIETDAVFGLDEDALLTTEEVSHRFGFGHHRPFFMYTDCVILTQRELSVQVYQFRNAVFSRSISTAIQYGTMQKRNYVFETLPRYCTSLQLLAGTARKKKEDGTIIIL